MHGLDTLFEFYGVTFNIKTGGKDIMNRSDKRNRLETCCFLAS